MTPVTPGEMGQALAVVLVGALFGILVLYWLF